MRYIFLLILLFVFSTNSYSETYENEFIVGEKDINELIETKQQGNKAVIKDNKNGHVLTNKNSLMYSSYEFGSELAYFNIIEAVDNGYIITATYYIEYWFSEDWWTSYRNFTRNYWIGGVSLAVASQFVRTTKLIYIDSNQVVVSGDTYRNRDYNKEDKFFSKGLNVSDYYDENKTNGRFELTNQDFNLTYSTFLFGGDKTDKLNSIANFGNYIWGVGYTESDNIPVTGDAVKRNY